MAKINKSGKKLPQLYAVLVGINDYPYLPKEKQLSGCNNDVALMQGLLQEGFLQAQFSAVHLLPPILGREATKTNIVAAIRGHLGKAKAGDYALFYYSGHGIRELTDIEPFREEELDANIGGIICSDFRGPGKKDPDDTVLADKEFRFLIRELAEEGKGKPKAQVITIFDCCHSGSNTRSILSDEIPARARQLERRALPARNWKGFLFHDAPGLWEKVQKKASLEEILPQGNHIMMAACLEVELAWEAETGPNGQSNGAFTQALTEVLRQHNGQVSYHDLHTRVLNKLRFYYQDGKGPDRRQTPQFYIQANQASARYQLFLSDQLAGQQADAPIEYNAAEKEWRLSLGALHGLPAETAKPILATMFPLKDRKNKKEAKVKKVFLTHATLEPPAGLKPTDGPFLGRVENLAIAPLRIFLSGEAKGLALARKKLGEYLQNGLSFFTLADKEDDADYVLHADQGLFTTYLPFNRKQPLLKSIDYRKGDGSPDPAKVAVAYNDFQQMARWAYLKNLDHFSARSPIGLRIYQYEGAGKERLIAPKGNQIQLELSEEMPHTWIRFELENQSPTLLHLSLIYMPFNFGFLTEDKFCFLKKPQVPLLKGEIAASRKIGVQPPDNNNGKEYLRVVVDDYTRDYNWQTEHNYMKVLASKTPFDIAPLHLAPLPTPKEEVSRTRGYDFGGEEAETTLPEFDWEVRTIEVMIGNPMYTPD